MKNTALAEMNLSQTLVGLTLTVILLVVCKFESLLQYWQQAHQTVLPVENIPRIPFWPAMIDTLDAASKQLSALGDAAKSRTLIMGRVLLAGDNALPVVEKPVPVVQACPKPQKLASSAPAAAVSEPSSALANAMDALVQAKAPAASASRVAEAGNGGIEIKATDRVLLAGDSMMQGVAPHLANTLRRQYGIESVDLSRQSTGLAYPSFFDWPATVRKEFKTGNYKALVMMLGANDTWDIIQKGRAVPFGTDNWKTAYSERVATIMEAAQEYNVRVVWLGAPPMGRDKMITRVPVLNEVYSREAAKHSAVARYVATGPVLSPDGSSFAKFLDLPKRGKVMVRADDGVHFTPTGQRLLARLALSQFNLPQLAEAAQ